jgi:predicted DNA-binding transcriptional regulator YafY
VRASRLVGLLSLLQARGRMSASELARELEVSPRTILRDIEALSSAGIPVYAVRGREGGFELLDGFKGELPATWHQPDRRPAGAVVQRARIRLSPRGRRLAALLGRPAGLRIRRSTRPDGDHADRGDWVEAWVRIESADATVLDLLALGAEAEVVQPAELRARVAETARRIADLNDEPPGHEDLPGHDDPDGHAPGGTSGNA